MNEKAERVAECTKQVCASLVEETLNSDIILMVEEILDAELQRIHKCIKRQENRGAASEVKKTCNTKPTCRIIFMPCPLCQ